MFKLRKVNNQDIEFAKNLHHIAYRGVVESQFGSWDEKVQDKFFNEKWNIESTFIIEKEEMPIGILAVVENRDHIFLSEIQIDPKFQRQGIGTAIVLEQIEKATIKNLPLRLQVLHKNFDAKKLYERLGFLEIDKTERHYVLEYKIKSS